jgi:hypothetical protein
MDAVEWSAKKKSSPNPSTNQIHKKIMKYEISKDRKTLTIFADSGERSDLTRQTQTSEITSGVALTDWLESLVCNSELQWVTGETSGDLTSAPMLGILGDEMRANVIKENDIKHFGLIQCGHDRNGAWFQPILERWAFMDYQVRSVLEALRDTGNAVFTS